MKFYADLKLIHPKSTKYSSYRFALPLKCYLDVFWLTVVCVQGAAESAVRGHGDVLDRRPQTRQEILLA